MSGLMMSSASGVKSSKTCKPIDQFFDRDLVFNSVMRRIEFTLS